MKTDLFQSCGHCWVFQICWHIECNTFTASSFRIWNNWNSSPPLALFIAMLSKAHLTSHSRVFGSRWVITPSWLARSWRSFLYSSSVYSCHVFLISSASVAAAAAKLLQSCPTLCNPMDHSMPGLHHQLPEFTQLMSIESVMPLNCCTQSASKSGKLSIGHRTGKGQFSFQSQRKAMPKNAQTTKQLHSSHTLVK